MLKRFSPLLVLWVAFVVVSCSDKHDTNTPPSDADTALITPKIDSKTYRALVLPNGLRAMLVNDPEATKAAASLNVDVGSGADVKGREGLAHFLEHMLFLGTEKYPEAGAYQAFISSQGGQHNAYTSFSDTNYYFDVDAKALQPTLDRFAAFFYAPLFSQEYLERERNAVNSEYFARIDNEMRRYLDVLKTVMNPKHPFTQFSVGNLDTLYTKNLAQDVRAFYKQYYVAGNMSLAVVGPTTLDQQEQWVRDMFAAVPVGNVPNMAQSEPLFNAGVLPQIIEVKPKKEQRSLSLSFPIQNLYKQRLDKPMLMLGHLLGHEGEGSLFQVLRQKGWVEALSAGNFLDDNGEGLFTITMNLTETGVKHQNAVVEAVFSAIALIRKNGLQQWRYQELADVSALQFDYQPQSQVLSQAQSLASSMADYPQQYWLNGPYALRHFNQALLVSIIASLNPQNVLVSLVAPDVTTEKTSPWYNTQYKQHSVSVEQLKRWQNPAMLAGLHLPSRNPFIPSRLSNDVEEQARPSVLLDEAGLKIWYQAINRFNEPRAYVKLSLVSSRAGQTAQQSAVMAIAAKMLNDEVNSALYEAKAIGYSFGISDTAFGLEISTYGYDEKINALLAATIAPIKSIKWDQSQYLRARDELVRRWENAKLKPPYRVLAGAQYADYLHPSWRKSVLAASVESMNFEVFLKQWQQLSQFDSVQGLIVGNVSKQKAQAIANTMKRFKPITKSTALRPRVNVAVVDATPLTTSLQLASADSAVLVYIQTPASGYRARALSALTASIYEADFYGQLRTEQQLGYIVYFANRLLKQTAGLMMIVQSPTYSPEHIITAINTFWLSRLNASASMEEQFVSHKQSLAVSLQKPAKNTAEFAARHWRNIGDEVYSFDQREQLVQALNTVSFDEWLVFVKQLMTPEFRGRHIYTAQNK